MPDSAAANNGSAEQGTRERVVMTREQAVMLAQRAQELRAAGEKKGALDLFRQAYDGYPSPDLLWHIAELCHDLGQPKEGLEALRRYRQGVAERDRREGLAALEEKLTQELSGRPLPPSQPSLAVAHEQTSLPKLRYKNVDIGLSAGLALWITGVSDGLHPSAALALTGGYTVRALSKGPVELRLGVRLGYGYVSDPNSLVSFISLLIDPILRFRLGTDRLWGFFEAGIGGVIISGLADGSLLLVPGSHPIGGLGQFEFRPALGLECRIVPSLAVFLTPALLYSPSPSSLFADSLLLRIEIAAGVSARF